jgi:hypothetical protein
VGPANYDWQSQHDIFALFMPKWPAGSGSYPSRIIGDAGSATVFYTDTAGLFGPAEIRAVGVVNFEAGKVVRWIDYWDGRQFGLTNLALISFLVEVGLPQPVGELLASLGQAIREGQLNQLTADVEQLTGRKPTSVHQVLEAASIDQR